MAKHRLRKRVLFVGVGLLVGLLLAEGVLWMMGWPPSYRPRSTPGQFMFVNKMASEGVGYVNAPSHLIRFVYDGNPRGYFSSSNSVDHQTNMAGFRGPSVVAKQDDQGQVIIEKPPGTRRIVFLGDSFTFGEGVWLKDTYAERTAAKLRAELGIQEPSQLHALNLGVAGYNTQQELDLLEKVCLPSRPDLIVLGYVLNDAEPPLFQSHPVTGQPYRVSREIEEMTSILPPETLIYRSRIARLFWHFSQSRRVTQKTVEYYRSLYDDSYSGRDKSLSALAKIAATCREHQIPLIVVIFPLLLQLDDSYPFRDVHAMVERTVTTEGAVCIDLLPQLQGRRASRLWVHPTDHHPNEIVHHLAADAIAAEITSRQWLKNQVEGLK